MSYFWNYFLEAILSEIIIKNLSESFLKSMTCQQIAMRKLINQKYDEYEPNLNPFCNLLYCENWSWPQMHILQSTVGKHKQPVAKASSMKTQIELWFLGLNHAEKCAVTMIKNANFLHNFLKTFHEWNPSFLYHIYQHRKVTNYLAKTIESDATRHILSYCCIAWFDEPILYFNVDAQESEGFFHNFINWMDQVSNKKIFQYAHKIKSKADPQENLLWFTEKSFQSLEAWIVNQFEQTIIKSFFNKNSCDSDMHTKIQKLLKGLQSSQTICKKQIQMLLSTKIADTKNKSEADFKQFQQRVKKIEDQYYESALLLQYDEQAETGEKNESPKKKKRKPKRKNKKKNQNEVENGKQQREQSKQQKNGSVLITQMIENQTKPENQLAKCNYEPIIFHEERVDCVQQLKSSQEQQIQTSLEKRFDSKQNQKVDEICKSQSAHSEHSDDWSNVQTTKTTKKSGHSHPEFNQMEKMRELKAKRSLSPEEKANSISKLKRKARAKNKGNQISSWNGDESVNENNLEILNENSNKQQVGEKQTNQMIEEKQVSESMLSQQIQKKKKKKPSKASTMMRELATKMSSMFVNKQLNNFIDSLSIETNNLYDHKIVSFERVRFFIQSLFPASQACLFGSNAVGLSLPTSDIDIMLFNLPCCCREEAIEILAHLAVQINTMGWILSCSTYLNAKVPLVKLEIDPTIEYVNTKRKCDFNMARMLDPRMIQHLELKSKNQNKELKSDESKMNPNGNIIKVDLTINITEEGILGSQSTELMKQWMNRYPQIHMCILALKYVLAQKDFSSNFKGGLGSYCLFVMVAAYIREYPELEKLDDGEFFLSTLKFYGEEFENQIKSIILQPLDDSPNTQNSQPKTCFISLQQTLAHVKGQLAFQCQVEDPVLLFNIQSNPLRIFDPIHSRVMSGSCHLFTQIKAEFRRIYKQFENIKETVEKQIELTVSAAEVSKMLENKKSMDKWLNKYESRNRICVKDVLAGGFN